MYNNRQSRYVPFPAKLGCLFGGGMNQVGWFIFGFGMIFFWAFASRADISGLYKFAGEVKQTEGVIVSNEKTNIKVQNIQIVGNRFKFSLNGESFEGISYAAGDMREVGSKASLEYPAGDPASARIVGMRAAPMSPYVALISLISLAGLTLIFFGVRSGLKALKLLKVGEVAQAKLVSKKSTNMEINNRRVYKLEFEFTAKNGRPYKAMAKTHQTELYQDEAYEIVVYDPSNPDFSYMRDALPGGASMAETGQVIMRGKPWLSLIIPTIVIGCNYLYVRTLL